MNGISTRVDADLISVPFKAPFLSVIAVLDCVSISLDKYGNSVVPSLNIDPVVGCMSPVIVPANVNPTPVVVKANVPAVVVVTPALPIVTPVAVVSPIIKIPAPTEANVS